MTRKFPIPVLCLAVLASPIWAQQANQSVRGILSGYGAVGYSAHTEGAAENNFSAALSPLLLYQVSEDILVEGEFDIELEEADTELHLEHAQVWRVTCARCHNLRPASEFASEQWPIIVNHMRTRQDLTKLDTEAVAVFLQELVE